MSQVGITGFGAYVPRLRLQRSAIASAGGWYNAALHGLATGERAIASWDEDAITMAVEAARDCLTGAERSDISQLILASTSLPFADRQNAGIVKEALVLSDTVGTLDIGGSQRAGVAALKVALDAARAGHGSSLCVAAEKRVAPPTSIDEMMNGDAAVALCAGSADVLAEYTGSYSATADFVDHYRADGWAHDYAWEGRWVRDEGYMKLLVHAIRDGLTHNHIAASDIDHVVLALPGAGGVEQQVARAAGISPDRIVASLHHRLGYAGAAQPLILLAQLLAQVGSGKRIALIGFGQGMDMLLFRTTERVGRAAGLGVDGWLDRGVIETNYLKHLHFAGEVKLETGMRAELDLKASHSALYRDRKTVLGLVGGKCRVTGTVQYPRSAVSVDRDARLVDTQHDHPLADLPARIVTVTADHLAFTPDPPAVYGMIEFEGGGRFIADMIDIGDGLPQPGDTMRMMFRRKRVERRGFVQYFWKAAPDDRA